MPRGEKGNRPLRIAAEIRRDLPDILRKHIDLPSGLLVSITGVEVSPDLSQARIFFSVLGKHEIKAAAELEHLLNGKRGVVRTEIARRLVMRQHPELKFIYDETPARAARIESLLNQIHNESRAPEGGKDE
jgi:ribosome-binding factor A